MRKEGTEMASEKYGLFDNTHFGIIKGIGIFVIVLVHLCNRYLDFPFLSPIAGAAVSIFLLCSGYGLSESFKKKKLHGYWTNKFVKIWIPSFLSVSLVAIFNRVGIVVWATEYPLFLYGWYLEVLFCEYLLFWIIYRYITRKYRVVLFWMVSIVMFICTAEQIYAEQLFCFPLGLTISEYGVKAKIESISLRKMMMILIMLGIMIIGSYLCRHSFDGYLLFNLVWHVFKTSSAVAVILAVYVIRRVSILTVFIPLGTISYSLYLLNNHTMSALKVMEITVGNVFVVLLLTFVIAYLFTLMCNYIVSMSTKWSMRKGSVV